MNKDGHVGIVTNTQKPIDKGIMERPIKKMPDYDHTASTGTATPQKQTPVSNGHPESPKQQKRSL